MRIILPIAASLLVGCAALDKLDEPDPTTGKTPAEDIQETSDQVAKMLPPPFNWILPAGTGAALLVLTAIGNAGKKDEEPT